MSTFEYDDAGRMVRSVTVTESEFSPDDVALLIASRRADRSPRGTHGHLLSVAKDPANQFKWRVETEDDYAARALHYRQELWRKQYPDSDPSAKLWRVILDE